jgi:ATP-dependent DNA helicase RecQ
MSTEAHIATLADVVRKYWGYDSFRPLQKTAMQAVLDGDDSLVVLPTGGGKSLCYQAPAICRDGLAVVVSPLISLMKDQVDALVECGVPAACVNSTHSPAERRRVADEIRDGTLRLLYVAPERLMTERMLGFLETVNVSFIAIDEAHCISEWGHDFRPEYRSLKTLKTSFPSIALHSYTATATPRVRQDIIQQLGLTDPQLFIGSFDRPNLVYKVTRRRDRLAQILDVLQRHERESGIIYCISRKNVDDVSSALRELGHRALPYHAGLEDTIRKEHQEAFIQDRADIIVATVAFGMGIDKSNVRFVIHAGMPKSLEAYQQESGRAGRDGLEAECCLFYSGADYNVWQRLLGDLEGEAHQAAMASLSAMYNFCTGVACRHHAIVGHFGQELEANTCKACDVCLDDLDLVEDPLVVAQKILSCVVRLEERFGSDYTAKVLSGSNDQRIMDLGHNSLSTWGLLSEHGKQNIRDWIEQLLGQGFLEKTGEFNTLSITPVGRQLLSGEAAPKLLKPRSKKKSKRSASGKSGVAADSWEGVDQNLFALLRELRREKSDEREVPAYIVFGDAALRDMARLRPSSREAFREVKGVGEKKLKDYADDFVACIVEFCSTHNVTTDVFAQADP